MALYMWTISILSLLFFVNFNQSKKCECAESRWKSLGQACQYGNVATTRKHHSSTFTIFPHTFTFFQINTHNYYNVSMFDKLVLFFTITQRKSAKDDFGMSPKQKEVSGVLVKKLTTTQYVLIIIINFYKGSKSGIRKYVKIENTAKCVEQEEGWHSNGGQYNISRRALVTTGPYNTPRLASESLGYI